jgi:hypothetical protein
VYNSNKTPLLVVAALLAVCAASICARIGIFDDSLYLKAGQLILDGLVRIGTSRHQTARYHYLSAAIAAVGAAAAGAAHFPVRVRRRLPGRAGSLDPASFRTRRSDRGDPHRTFLSHVQGYSSPIRSPPSRHSLRARGSSPPGAVTRRWAAAGALLALATVFKQTGLLYVAAFVVFAVFDTRRRHQIQRIRRNARLAHRRLSGRRRAT